MTDPEMRARLLDAAARLLAEQGPNALTTRRVAAEADTSTMAVYTQFGSIAGLVRATIEDGFARLAKGISQVALSDDPVADLTRFTLAYVSGARHNPNLYSVMFGSASLGSFRPTTVEELQTGRTDTLDHVVATFGRAITGGRFVGDAWLLTNQWWSAVHGYTVLEHAGFIRPSGGEAKVFLPMVQALFVGFGDNPDRAADSIRAGAAPAQRI